MGGGVTAMKGRWVGVGGWVGGGVTAMKVRWGGDGVGVGGGVTAMKGRWGGEGVGVGGWVGGLLLYMMMGRWSIGRVHIISHAEQPWKKISQYPFPEKKKRKEKQRIQRRGHIIQFDSNYPPPHTHTHPGVHIVLDSSTEREA